MAYRCINNGSKECDGCEGCAPKRPPETGVTITATLELRMTVYGDIEERMRRGEDVSRKAEELVQDTIDCCGLAGRDMSISEIEYELNE